MDAHDWPFMKGGGTCGIFATDLPIHNGVSGPSIQSRRSLLGISILLAIILDPIGKELLRHLYPKYSLSVSTRGWST